MKDYCQRLGWYRLFIVLIGCVILGIGCSLLRLSALGNDSYTAMNLAVSALLPISYANFQVLVGLVLFIVQLAMARTLIGIGTVINMCGLSYVITFAYDAMVTYIGAPTSLVGRILTAVIGLIIAGLGLSLYQVPDAGVSPYDALAIIIDRRTRIPYFWCRIMCDATCALIGFLCGGLIGIGTLICTFGLGPVIHFFNRVFTEKIVTPMEHKQ